MNIISIPKELIDQGDLVLIPRKQLEELIRMSERAVKEVHLNVDQKKALILARSNKKVGKFLSFDEFRYKLGLTN